MSSLPATQESNNLPEGLEDLDSSDLTVPTIRINHKEGIFEDSNSGQQWDKLECVVLGLVKQRVLWDADIDNDGPPLCRSYEHKLGYPSKDDKDNWRFPWAASGFEPTEDPLPCNSCKLKEWGTHPTRDTPWCSEQYTLVIAIPVGEGVFSPALLQLQRSGWKPTKSYLGGFLTSKVPSFTVNTIVSLESKRKGTTDYSTPKFTRNGDTDTEDHPEFADTYRRVRGFLQTPYTRSDDSDDEETPVAAPTNGAASAPESAPAASSGGIQGSAPAADTAAASDDEEEELPF